MNLSTLKTKLCKFAAPLAVALVVPGGSLLVALAWLVQRRHGKI